MRRENDSKIRMKQPQTQGQRAHGHHTFAFCLLPFAFPPQVGGSAINGRAVKLKEASARIAFLLILVTT